MSSQTDGGLEAPSAACVGGGTSQRVPRDSQAAFGRGHQSSEVRFRCPQPRHAGLSTDKRTQALDRAPLRCWPVPSCRCSVKQSPPSGTPAPPQLFLPHHAPPPHRAPPPSHRAPPPSHRAPPPFLGSSSPIALLLGPLMLVSGFLLPVPVIHVCRRQTPALRPAALKWHCPLCVKLLHPVTDLGANKLLEVILSPLVRPRGLALGRDRFFFF